MFYFKCYPTFYVPGLLFNLHRSRAYCWMLRLQLLLDNALDRRQSLTRM
ncbi:transposase family protein [Trichodesmium erythraeum]|nr:transposase family protein [Trichodesmium erythraeum GBRTRLIN201]